jgi:uncharacterized protein (DUF2267 family)
MINDTLKRPSIRSHMRRREKKHPLNLERFASEGNRFIKDVAFELGISRNSAARIIKAVLHAVRDRLPPDDAVEFSQGLPMFLKAVYFDQYDLSRTPVVIRRAHDFLDFIFYKDEMSASADFPTANSVERALKGVFNVLELYMDHGQIEQVKHIMGGEIRELIESREYHGGIPLFD